MHYRPDSLKFRIFWSRLISAALVVFGLLMATAAVASNPPTDAHTGDALAQASPCEDKCPGDAPEDLCADDCPDCTHCHSVAPTLAAYFAGVHVHPLPNSKDPIPVASIAPSNLGYRLFRPPQPS